jgi:hypothetical protein
MVRRVYLSLLVLYRFLKRKVEHLGRLLCTMDLITLNSIMKITEKILFVFSPLTSCQINLHFISSYMIFLAYLRI